ncbi:hypothetical protein CRUP_005403, partial [Coryphaenoides rupestris]
YEFSPQTLCCYGKQLCTISRDGTYFSYQNRAPGLDHAQKRPLVSSIAY